MSSFFPLGGIPTQTSVILAYYDGSTQDFWILTKTDTYNFNLIFRKPIIIDTNGVVTTNADVINNVAIFTTSIPAAGQLQLLPDFNYVSQDSTGTVAVTSTTTPANLTYSQTQVQDWTNPPQLLTGIPYVLVGGNNTLSYLFEDGSTTGIIRQITPYFITTTAYFGCTSTSVSQFSNINNIIQLSYCSIKPNLLPPSACAGLPPAAWTNPTDCMNGFIYTYCQPGVYCNGKCQSTCQQAGQTCAYTVQNRSVTVPDPASEGANGTFNIPTIEYICQVTANPTGPTNAVGTSWWVIVLIVIAAVIIIILLFFIYRRIISDNAKQTKETAGDSTDTQIIGADAYQYSAAPPVV